jgi:hypothetical protein
MKDYLSSVAKILFGALLLFGAQANAQRVNYAITGRITDAATKEPLAFATIGAPGTSFGTRTDEEGFYTLQTTVKITELKVTYVGYQTLVLPVNFTSPSIKIDVALEPQSTVLKEVVIKPKKYRNKNNPAVELIKLVVENRDRNRVENMSTYQEEQYEKIMFGVSNLSEKTKNRKLFKQWKFALDNVDTTKLEGEKIIPAYLQENIQNFYSQADPKRKKTVVTGTQQVLFPIMDQDGIDRYIRYLYQDVNIYDNFVVLLTDHFISPIANNAELFYRYYPADTTEEAGKKVVRLQFFPRNKTDMLLQGELFIALDSTYPVTKINFTVNPDINLNWARHLEVTQDFDKLPESGKWVLVEENLNIELGLTKRSVGTFGQRYISHRNIRVGDALPPKIFEGESKVVLESAKKKDDNYWVESRHTALSGVEANTYRNIDSLQRTKLFINASKIVFTLAMGHYKPGGGIEIGRLNNTVSYNAVEGYRLRFGGRTNPEFSKRFNLEGFGAYGTRDQQFKFGVGTNIGLSRGRYYNSYPYNLLRINYQHDLTVPGILQKGTFMATNIVTSITRTPNDRFFFQKKLHVNYEKEWRNHLSVLTGFEHIRLEQRGSLPFVPVGETTPVDDDLVVAKPYVQLRFAPGEEFYQTQNGWRQRIRFKFIGTVKYARGVSNFLGSEYNFDEVLITAYKFSNTYPLGYNYCYFEAGAIMGKVPYPLLTVHRGNQSLSYRFLTYNMMNFMEFVSDRYVALNMEQSFYGFFTNKIPLVKKLKLRELATIKVLYGQVSDRNQPTEGSQGLYQFPRYPDGTPLTYTLQDKPYIEASIGLANIFKVLRVELVRRFTYLDHPYTQKFGIRINGQVQF